MRDVGKKIFDLDIRRLENRLGVKLPEEYRAFLEKYNGGRPNAKYFLVVGFDNEPRQILDFYGIDDPIESCRLDWNFEVLFGRMPNGFFPIACEDGGNIICLSLAAKSYGNIFYWDHDEESQPATYVNVYKVADTFKEFFDGLH
jgi:cell wall assembly regulator SMI1